MPSAPILRGRGPSASSTQQPGWPSRPAAATPNAAHVSTSAASSAPHERPHEEPAISELHDRVGDELARAVVGHLAAALDADQLDAALGEERRCREHVLLARRDQASARRGARAGAGCRRSRLAARSPASRFWRSQASRYAIRPSQRTSRGAPGPAAIWSRSVSTACMWRTIAGAGARALTDRARGVQLPAHGRPRDGRHAPRMQSPTVLPNLFSPLTIGGVTIRNRIMSSGHDTVMARDGLVTDRLIAYQEARARGGAGLIVIQVAGVHPTARYTSTELTADTDATIPGYAAIARLSTVTARPSSGSCSTAGARSWTPRTARWPRPSPHPPCRPTGSTSSRARCPRR